MFYDFLKRVDQRLCRENRRSNFYCILLGCSFVTQLCSTLANPMDFNSAVRGISQARILDRVAMPSSRGSSWSRDWTPVSCIAGGFFTVWTTREFLHYIASNCKYIHQTSLSKSFSPSPSLLPSQKRQLSSVPNLYIYSVCKANTLSEGQFRDHLSLSGKVLRGVPPSIQRANKIFLLSTHIVFLARGP